MAKTRVAVVENPAHINLPFWKEMFSGLEYLCLRTSKVYYGIGAPKGDGSAVVVVPGFLGIDAYLFELYLWLKRIGYKPYFSRIGHVASCPDVLLHRLIRTVNRAYNETGRPVHLVGHSFGGVLSRAVARRHPDRVASVITLGSPFRGVRVNPWIVSAIKQVQQRQYRRGKRGKDCLTEGCACGFLCTVRDEFPASVPHTNVYTKSDGVVDWNICAEGDDRADVEVGGTHVGLVWNHEVYNIVAERLSDANQENQARALKETVPLPPRARKAKSRVTAGTQRATSKPPPRAAAKTRRGAQRKAA